MSEDTTNKPGHVLHESIPLVRQLADMANLPHALCKRMVLVLDVGDVPRLYVQTYLTKERCQDVQLTPTPLQVAPLTPTTLEDVLPDVSIASHE